MPWGRRLAGFAIWHRWNCRGCGSRLRWEHSRAVGVAMVALLGACGILCWTALWQFAVVILAAAYLEVFFANRAELVFERGKCLKCGDAIDGPACVRCGWLAG